ncbi:MAG: hypothetical protein ABIP38_04765, partial [Steroidobacteraceae bacterium]
MQAGDDRFIPLVVDAGALLKTDLSQERVLQFLARMPWQAWRLPLWFLQGRTKFRRELQTRVPMDISAMVLAGDTLAHISSARSQGRSVYIASADDSSLVPQLVDAVGASGAFIDTGEAGGEDRALALNAALGAGGYEYIGSRLRDFPVWQSARGIVAISRSESFGRRVHETFPHAQIIKRPRPALSAYSRALRPHQWAKNAL